MTAIEQVALLEDIDHEADRVFEEHNFSVVRFPRSVSQAELVEVAHDSVALGLRSSPELTAAQLDRLPKLRAVGGFAINPNLPWQELRKRGIYAINSPTESASSVAELAVMHMLLLLRGGILDRISAAREGNWQKPNKGSRRAEGKTLALLGAGGIGRRLAKIARALEMDVIFMDPYVQAVEGCEKVDDSEDFFSRANVLSIHADPPDKETIVGERELGLMPQGSWLINTARGYLVDEEALRKALELGNLAGAGLDVIKSEPSANGPFENPFIGQDVNISPHEGASTDDAQREIAHNTARKIARNLVHAISVDSKTIPEVDGNPRGPKSKRISFFHFNKEGALDVVTHSLAQAGINVDAASSLVTDSEYGYIWYDIASNTNPGILDQVVAKIRTNKLCIRVEVLG